MFPESSWSERENSANADGYGPDTVTDYNGHVCGHSPDIFGLFADTGAARTRTVLGLNPSQTANFPSENEEIGNHRTDSAQKPAESERKMKFPVVIRHRREKATIYGKTAAFPFYRIAPDSLQGLWQAPRSGVFHLFGSLNRRKTEGAGIG